jgi:hypothetical protein
MRSINQNAKAMGQASSSGKTNLLIGPEPVSIKDRLRPQRVPLTVMRVAPKIADLFEKPSYGNDGIAKGLREFGDLPTRVFLEQRQ